MLKSEDNTIFAEVIACKGCDFYQPVCNTCGNCFYTTVIQKPDDWCSHAKKKSKILKASDNNA
jgi:hypothetical protein